MTHVNSKHATHELRFASWNIRSLVKNKPKQLAALAGANNFDFVIIQELRRDMSQGDRITGSYCLWCTGHNGNNNHGVGFLVHDRIEVIDFIIHKIANSSARAAQLIIATKKGRRSIYALYAPHAGYEEDFIQHFWENAADLPDIAKSIIGVDANAHIHPADWMYPPNQPDHKTEIPRTSMCGLHFLAFTSTLDLRPANMMLSATWAARTTFTGNEKAPRSAVIDFILIPANTSNEFPHAAVVQENTSALLSDHKMLVATWRLKIHRYHTAPSARPTMGPETSTNDHDISPSDDIYRELFRSIQTLHPNETPTHSGPHQGNIPTHHIKYTNWIPSSSITEKLQNLIASLKRSKAPKESINIARKRLREAALERHTKARKKNWGTLVDAFKLNNTKDAFRMVQQSRPRTPRRRYTRNYHHKERGRLQTVYTDPPQQPPITPTNDHKALYADPTPLSTEQLTQLETFNPYQSDATFVDGSFSEAKTAKDATRTAEAVMACTAKCGWAAFNAATMTVIFGAAAPNTELSANHGEALAILGAQVAFDPPIIVTDSTYVINTAANLACEAVDDMQHIPNSDTWREIWRHHGKSPSLLAKITGHTGAIPHEVADIFAFIGATLPPGESRKCTLDDETIKLIATNNTEQNERTKKARRAAAASLRHDSYPALIFDRATKNPPRRALDHIPPAQEIKKELNELNKDSAAGPDGIKTRDLLHPQIFPILVRLIQEIWKSGKIPQHWLKNYLVGIPKPHDTVTRGIALTATCLKVLTAIIRRRAAGFELLSCQWGFRSHRGTAQATTLLREMLNRRSTAGRDTTVIAIDLRKAFDSVRRDEIDKLLIEYGYGNTAANLVKQMYSGDTLYLFLNNENLSDPITPEKGVKQGCLLSSGIFNLFIDRALRVMLREYPNIAGSCPEKGPIVLAYADDMAIIAHSDDEAAIFLHKFATVLESYGLKINEDKTKALRALSRSHEAIQTTTTYSRRSNTQEKWSSAWDRPTALLDAVGSFAATNVLRATLHMPSGQETNLTCSHCTYIATNVEKSTVQDLMWAHCKRIHLENKKANLTRHVTLYGPPRTPPSTNVYMLTRPIMTNAQARTMRPLYLPPLKCGPFSFEAVEELVYLGSIIHQHGDTRSELNKRISAACAAYGTLRRITDNENTNIKVWLYDLYVGTRLFYGTETWAQTLAQTSRLNSIRMKHIRTLTKNWYQKHLSDFGCPAHPYPPLAAPQKQDGCKKCLALGTACFYYMRKFIVHLNTLRNARILSHTYYLHIIIRNRTALDKATTITFRGKTHHSSNPRTTIIHLIADFLGPPTSAHGNTQPAGASNPGQPFEYRKPYWGPEFLPLRSNGAIRKKWNLRTTATIIEQRRANLLGNLIRNNATPPNDITQRQRADWWKSCLITTTKMKTSLEHAHDISFWKLATKRIGNIEKPIPT